LNVKEALECYKLVLTILCVTQFVTHELACCGWSFGMGNDRDWMLMKTRKKGTMESN